MKYSLGENPVNLFGKVMVDEPTGFRGVVIAKTVYAHRSPHVCLCATELKDGKPNEEWFDEDRLVFENRPAIGFTANGEEHAR